MLFWQEYYGKVLPLHAVTAKLLFNLGTPLWRMFTLTPQTLNPIRISPYLCLCDAEQHTDWINCWLVIVIIDLFCLSVTIKVIVIRTWHIRRSFHNILLQFSHHTALNATNPPTDHILLERLKSYILCTFLSDETSCVTLSISSYKHPYVIPLTQPVTNQFHYI